MDNNLRIIFMGSPEFAVPSLQILVENGHHIVGVVTAPDKPQGRGKKLGTSAVKDYALTQNLTILQPTNLKDEDFLEELQALKADLQIVVAFRMLPEVVWSMPPLGSYNLHASLLPDYRGAAPINWAIINGEKETGVTTFKLKHEIDTGNILFQEREPIREEDNAGSVYDKLKNKGARLVLKSVETITSGKIGLKPQKPTSQTRHAPKVFRQDCEIKWDQPSQNIRNFIRGMSPYPAAWTTLNEKTLKVFSSEISSNSYTDPPGTFKSDNKTFIEVTTSDGAVGLTEIQLQGKKRMGVGEFLRGYQL